MLDKNCVTIKKQGELLEVHVELPPFNENSHGWNDRIIVKWIQLVEYLSEQGYDKERWELTGPRMLDNLHDAGRRGSWTMQKRHRQEEKVASKPNKRTTKRK